MNAFAEVDGVINEWVEATGSSLFTEWAGKPARFFHVPGTPPFECFQVSIDPPLANRIVVLARAIDTNDGTGFELEQTWEGSVSELDAILATAMATVERWKARSPQSEE